MRPPSLLNADLQKKLAVGLFNFSWNLLEKTDRTPEEDDTLINAAHASRFHWQMVGTPINIARGEWQLSRVYAVLARPEPALYHARRCLEICQKNSFADFDLAYAYEALARASALAGQDADRDRWLTAARAAGEQIAELVDREQFFSDLATVE